MNRDQWEKAYRRSRTAILDEYQKEKELELIDAIQEEDEAFKGEASVLILMEKLVERVAQGEGAAYEIDFQPNGRGRVRETTLGRRLRRLIRYIGFFDTAHEYSEGPLAFLDACWMLSSVFGDSLSEIALESQPLSLRHAEMLNHIAERIRMSTREYWYQRGVSDRRWTATRRAGVMEEYTERLLRYYARLLIVRLDLQYRKEARVSLTIDQVYAHLDHLMYLKDWHPAFEGLVGYAWVIEQGDRDGYHLHVVFYFDGSKVCRDISKGFQIGELWSYDITKGMGYVENCNARKDRYAAVGIGMIHRDNPEECQNAIMALRYLGKDTQSLRMKPWGRREFDHGNPPDEALKRGRPPAMSQVGWI